MVEITFLEITVRYQGDKESFELPTITGKPEVIDRFLNLVTKMSSGRNSNFALNKPHRANELIRFLQTNYLPYRVNTTTVQSLSK